MNDWPVLSRYDSAHLKEIALPMGGIGTGFFTLGGRGELTDWQLMSRPHRGWRPMYSHLLLRTEVNGDANTAKLRVLEGDINEGLAGDSGAPPILAGIPRFRDLTFEAAYPFGRVNLHDDDTPVEVSIEGFNPLIPGDTDASSLPIALLTIQITNKTAASVKAALTLLLSNFVGTDGITSDLKDNVTEHIPLEGWSGMGFSKNRLDKNARNGSMVMLFDVEDVKVARRWLFRDRPWNGEFLGIIDSLLDKGYIEDADPGAQCPPSPDDTWDSSITATVTLEANETKTVRLLVAWHFPYRNMAEAGWWSGKPGDEPTVQNYYTKAFEGAYDVAKHVIPRLADLRARSIAFVKSVVDRKAPHALREAALFNLTSLRSHTCFRLSDGTFLGFEGCNGTTGCCFGSCTHVWNYEEATVHLFPDLHRSMLESHLRFGMTETGGERFRITLPLSEPSFNGAAADGQMGVVVRIYEQYLRDRENGGLEWLKRWYPATKKMIEFAWEPGGWDADRDGVMEGSQHNTYDVEFFGPNPMCTVWYLAALAAGSKMARLTGDDAFAETCEDLQRKGSAWVDENLYNGSYYVQKEQIPDGPIAPMTQLGGELGHGRPRFQVGEGCLIDQLVGQYKANRVGLGDLLDRFHLKTAVKAIFHNNYRKHFRDHYNNMRTYAQGDEQGTLICSYPHGGRPEIPFPYWGECMTGFEYQLAVLLLDYGFKEEGTAVAKAIRDRHNGGNRNPFNEPECGSYYARCMASWVLLDAWDNGGKDW